MNRRFRVQVADADRPRMKGRTPHRLFYRLGGQAMGARITASSSGGIRSIHFAVTARGFASRTGRAWRGGEGERAALYIVREDALEGGEAGWWSNVAADRNELAAFHRASEAFEHHDRANANVYMSEVIALPDSLSAKQRRNAVRRYCQTFDSRGLGYTVAMHLPDPNGDGRNYHCHIVYSLRPVTRLGAYDWSLAVSKVADVNTPDGIRARRGLAVAAINATLKAAGSAQRYTDASNRARGLGAPSPKQGQKQTWALRRAAVVEARSAALARLQAATSTLRAGLAVLARAETARGDIRSRLRGMQEYNAAARADSDQRMAAVRIRVQDGLSRERTLATATEPAGRITVAKSNVVDALAGAIAGFTSPDAFAARIAAVADARARRKARRQADAEALTAAADKLTAAPPPNLEPCRTLVVARLLENSTDLLRLLLTPTHAAVYDRLGVEAARIGAAYDADRQRIINLAPVRRPDDRKPVDLEAGRKSVPAAPTPAARTTPDRTPSIGLGLPTVAMVSEDLASRAANTPVTPPAPSNGTEGQDPAIIAVNREDKARRRRITAARETARAATLGPAAASPPVSIPPESHDEDLLLLQAEKDRQDAKKGR
ncbi:MobA/MobL family protein [Sphingomonas faeni]|uniref:MobA/MobL family protein n=1 Tax=Sphingomonas faeni TaxID=185950 RepID=UPI00334A40F1